MSVKARDLARQVLAEADLFDVLVERKAKEISIAIAPLLAAAKKALEFLPKDSNGVWAELNEQVKEWE